MAKQISRGARLGRSLVNEYHRSGNNIETLAKRLNIDRETTGMMLDQVASGRVPITGKSNQEWLSDHLKNAGQIGKGNQGEMKEINKHEGDDFTLRWYQGEIGKEIPPDVQEKMSRVRIIGHKKDHGNQRNDYISTPFADNLDSAWSAFGRTASSYQDDEIDYFEIETFEYNE